MHSAAPQRNPVCGVGALAVVAASVRSIPGCKIPQDEALGDGQQTLQGVVTAWDWAPLPIQLREHWSGLII